MQRSFYVTIGFLEEKSGSEYEFSQQELEKYRTFKLWLQINNNKKNLLMQQQQQMNVAFLKFFAEVFGTTEPSKL